MSCLLLASAVAFTAEARAGRRVWGLACALALAPAVVVLWHGQGETLDLFRGATWVAGAVAAVAAMHLGRDPANRRILIAGFLATIAVIAVRGAEQVLIEHAETVKAFEATKAQFFAERGWDPAGAAARSYERRLRQPEATGWFALSNLASAAMAFAVVFCASLSIERWREQRRTAHAVGGGAGGIALLPALLGLGAAAILLVNGSKGAVVATLFGLGACVLGLSRWRRHAPIVGLLIVLVAAAAPALRGLAPEGLAGEKSLLFRSQYLEGAARAMAESFPLGVGPDGFQDAYLRLKPERSPEDVQSAHAMAVDWLVTLGPIGAAWVALVILGLWRGGKRAVEAATDACDATASRDATDGRGLLVAATLIAVAMLLVEAYAELPILSSWWLIARGAAAVLFVAVLGSIGRSLGRSMESATGRVALWSATVALLAQAQIEMVYFMPGLVVWAWIILGVSAHDLPASGAGTPRRVSFAAVATTAVASVVLAFGLIPQLAQDRRMDAASDLLAPLASLHEAWPEAREALRRGGSIDGFVELVAESAGASAASNLRQSLQAAATPAMRMNAVLGAIEAFDRERRPLAAERLLAAREANPANWQPERAAIDQLLAASRRRGGYDVTDPSFAQAMALADESTRHWAMPRFAALRAEIALQRASTAPDEEAVATALAAAEVARALEPRNVRRWTIEGDLRAASADLPGAITAWSTALECDRNRELDPLAQLAPAERAQLEAKIATAEAARRGERTLPTWWPFVRDADKQPAAAR
jgi:hypothetical protein